MVKDNNTKKNIISSIKILILTNNEYSVKDYTSILFYSISNLLLENAETLSNNQIEEIIYNLDISLNKGINYLKEKNNDEELNRIKIAHLNLLLTYTHSFRLLNDKKIWNNYKKYYQDIYDKGLITIGNIKNPKDNSINSSKYNYLVFENITQIIAQSIELITESKNKNEIDNINNVMENIITVNTNKKLSARINDIIEQEKKNMARIPLGSKQKILYDYKTKVLVDLSKQEKNINNEENEEDLRADLEEQKRVLERLKQFEEHTKKEREKNLQMIEKLEQQRIASDARLHEILKVTGSDFANIGEPPHPDKFKI